MQNQDNQTPTTKPTPSVATPASTADSANAAADAAIGKAVQGDFIQKIVDKIKHSENILIALSRDPSIDEIAAAIGLTLYLDGIQKHVTAIYSGRTPDDLKFLQPESTFEKNTDSLRDFIISLDKDKADHLRYKLEGDYVKIFITPYKTTITEDDLNFSHGDYNVNFVIALNVPSAGNLDDALREHGRIMHDAAVVNITTGKPGRFGEIEWSNPIASSLCEMITELIFNLQDSDEKPLEKDVATALLSGIVAATDRFSNEHTNSDTLSIASKLMAMGADQRLISSHVKSNEIIHNEAAPAPGQPPVPRDRTQLAVDHADELPTTINPYAGMNPAAQLAPDANMGANPNPATSVTATNAVTPEDIIVQPVIPGAPNTNTNTNTNPNNANPNPNINSGANPTAPTAPSTPVPVTPPIDQLQLPNVPPITPPSAPISSVPSPAVTAAPPPNTPNMPSSTPSANTPVSSDTLTLSLAPPANNPTTDPNAPRPMALNDPSTPTTRQVGSTIQPPAPAPKKTKNYAEMMEAALAESNTPTLNTPTTPEPISNNPSTPPPPSTPASIPTPVTPLQAPASPVIMEPVANPAANTVLPPPPIPNPNFNNGMMPPVLPPVQMPPGLS